MKYSAIVLSAGTGSRMNSEIPKQYMDLMEKPVIYYSLKALQDSFVHEVVLVCGSGWEEYCQKEIVEKYGFTKVTQIVTGGAERYDSVFAGLQAVKDSDYVFIQDGARPMLDQAILENGRDCVLENKCCVAGMPVKDTIKSVNDDTVVTDTPDRSHMWIVQTPQIFETSIIIKAYSEYFEKGKPFPATDDAMMVEKMLGYKVKLYKTSYENIKITTPEDLDIASLFIRKTF